MAWQEEDSYLQNLIAKWKLLKKKRQRSHQVQQHRILINTKKLSISKKSWQNYQLRLQDYFLKSLRKKQ